MSLSEAVQSGRESGPGHSGSWQTRKRFVVLLALFAAVLLASAASWMAVSPIGARTNEEVLSVIMKRQLAWMGADSHENSTESILVCIEVQRGVFRFVCLRYDEKGSTCVGWGLFDEETLAIRDAPRSPQGLRDIVRADAKATCFFPLVGPRTPTAAEEKEREARLLALLADDRGQRYYTLDRFPEPAEADAENILGEAYAYALWVHGVDAAWFSPEARVSIVRIYRRSFNSLHRGVSLKDRLDLHKWTIDTVTTLPWQDHDQAFWRSAAPYEIDISTLQITDYVID